MVPWFGESGCRHAQNVKVADLFFECTERLSVFEDVYTFPLTSSTKWKVKSVLLNREWQGGRKWEKGSRVFGGGEGGREKEKKCIFHSNLVIKNIWKWQRKNGKFSFSLSPSFTLHFSFCFSFFISFFCTNSWSRYTLSNRICCPPPPPPSDVLKF